MKLLRFMVWDLGCETWGLGQSYLKPRTLSAFVDRVGGVGPQNFQFHVSVLR